MFYCVFPDDTDGTAAEAASGDTGTQDAGNRPGQLGQNIAFLTGYLVIVPQRFVGFIDQAAELCDVILLQSLQSMDGALVFIDRMLCPFSAYRIHDGVFAGLEGLFGKLSKSLDICHLLKVGKRGFAFPPSVIVGRTHQRVLHTAVGDDNDLLREDNGSIFKLQGIGIQENRVILLSHGAGKLIHDSAAHPVEIVLRVLPD